MKKISGVENFLYIFFQLLDEINFNMNSMNIYRNTTFTGSLYISLTAKGIVSYGNANRGFPKYLINIFRSGIYIELNDDLYETKSESEITKIRELMDRLSECRVPWIKVFDSVKIKDGLFKLELSEYGINEYAKFTNGDDKYIKIKLDDSL